MRPPTSWSRWTKQVVLRCGLLVGAYAAWCGVAWFLCSARTYSSTIIRSSNGVSQIANGGMTAYQQDPNVVRLILGGLAAAVLIATASVVWRVVRRSHGVGVAGVVVAVLVGILAVLGALTIGLYLLPLAAILVVLALPIAPERPEDHRPPPGWYLDATRTNWFYWDGWRWTEAHRVAGTI